LGRPVKQLAEHRLGAVVVIGPGQQITGIVPARDVMRVVGRVMTCKVVTRNRAETMSNVMEWRIS
jgi:CBS-domain-containing membrane protein